jgi:hypothetical protein
LSTDSGPVAVPVPDASATDAPPDPLLRSQLLRSNLSYQ